MIDDDLFDDVNLPNCPACYSEEVCRISDDDRIHALGLHNIFDFIGQINIITKNFRCTNCGYEF